MFRSLLCLSTSNYIIFSSVLTLSFLVGIVTNYLFSNKKRIRIRGKKAHIPLETNEIILPCRKIKYIVTTKTPIIFRHSGYTIAPVVFKPKDYGLVEMCVEYQNIETGMTKKILYSADDEVRIFDYDDNDDVVGTDVDDLPDE